jgi:predicted dehydrogenase
VGCGHWGRNLVRNFRALGALAAICDSRPEARLDAEALAPGIPFGADIEAVLEESSIRGVVVATPAITHAELCTRALRAGKDVFCEKPLALTYEDGRRLAALARAQQRILMVGHVLEYHPAILRILELIAAGELGIVRYLYSRRLNLGRVRPEENILWSFAPHDIAVMLRVVGSMPFQVMTAGGAYVQPNIADVTVTHLLFDNGLAGHIFVSWLNPFKEQRLVIVGSRRMVTFDDVAKELVLHDQRVELSVNGPTPVRGEGKHLDFASDEPLRLECLAFLDSIGTRQAPRTDADSALRVLRVLEAAQRSLVTQGQPVALPME